MVAKMLTPYIPLNNLFEKPERIKDYKPPEHLV